MPTPYIKLPTTVAAPMRPSMSRGPRITHNSFALVSATVALAAASSRCTSNEFSASSPCGIRLRPLKKPILVWAMMVTFAVMPAQDVTLRDKISPSVSWIHPLRLKAWTSLFLLCRTASVSSGREVKVKTFFRWSTTMPMSWTAFVSDFGASQRMGRNPPFLADRSDRKRPNRYSPSLCLTSS